MTESSFPLTFSSTNLRLRVAITIPVTASGPTVTVRLKQNPNRERCGGTGWLASMALAGRATPRFCLGCFANFPIIPLIHSAFTSALPYAERQGLAHSRLDLY
jgi:hypothetical protein